ncbi:MAG: diguanylate cyclase [Xenococcaceae cyanobacterium]
MDINTLKILLIEDNPADADWIGEILIEEKLAGLKLEHVNRVNEGLNILAQDYFDAVLLDLSLPDSQGIDNIAMVKQQAPELPIIVLTSLNDQNMAIKSVRKGAQDYLIKGGFEKELLIRSIRYAIERQRTKEQLRQQAERERLMGKMLEKIRQSLDLTEILATTVDEVRQFLKTDRVLIYCCESVRPGKIVAESRSPHLELPSDKKINSLELYLSISDSAHLDTAKDIWQFKSSSADVYQSTQNQLNSILTLPIWRGQQESKQEQKEQLWGMLVAHSSNTSRYWKKWEINFLQQLTTQVTIAIQQSELHSQIKKANEQLKQLAILDGLTGVANRRYFDRVFRNEWNRLAREKKPLSLILCDIDHFKIYNDTYGHPEGDACLKKVAQTLQQATKRAADLVARYGGEEFAVILPDTDAEGALFVANNIRQKLHKMKIPHSGSTVSPYITLSIGTATKIPTPEEDADDLLKKADLNLYQAKKQGRDRIVQSFAP